ncbi:aminotransferase class IV [Streptomyces sp. 184]|uniref:aminotransferase class IV n=1 Tax=Streptomyces sp. 184 TaxID=1827526 RepID=UPI0038920433
MDDAGLQKLALLGYGHFTSMRVDNGFVRGLGLHLDRLVRDCATVFGMPLDRGRVLERVREAADGRPGSWIARVTVFDPHLDVGRPADNGHPAIAVTGRKAPALPVAPIRVAPVRYVRDFPAVKHVGLFGALHVRRQAQLAGAGDALLHDGDGVVSEGPTWNVGFIRDDRVWWPDAAVLPGVTMSLLQGGGPDQVTTRITLRDVRRAEAAFATNAAVGVRSISAVGDTELPTGHPVLDMLRKSYLADVGEEL